MIVKQERLLGFTIILFIVALFVISNVCFAQDAETTLLLHMDGPEGPTSFSDSLGLGTHNNTRHP